MGAMQSMLSDMDELDFRVRDEVRSPNFVTLNDLHQQYGKPIDNPEAAADFVRSVIVPWWFDSHKKDWGFDPKTTMEEFGAEWDRRVGEMEEKESNTEDEVERHVQAAPEPEKGARQQTLEKLAQGEMGTTSRQGLAQDQLDREFPKEEEPPQAFEPVTPKREPEPQQTQVFEPVEPRTSQPYPSGDNPYADDEDEEEVEDFDTGEPTGQEGLDQWMKEAKKKGSEVKEALTAYKEALTAKYRREGYTGRELSPMVKEEMEDLNTRIAELFLSASEEEETGNQRQHTKSDVLAVLYQDIEHMAEDEEGHEEDEYDYDREDFDDEGEYNWDHHERLGKLKLEALKKKLVAQ